MQFAVGPNMTSIALGDALKLDSTFWQMNFRREWRASLSRSVQINAGLDIDLIPYDVTFIGPPAGSGEGDGAQPSMLEHLVPGDDQHHANGVAFRPGGVRRDHPHAGRSAAHRAGPAPRLLQRHRPLGLRPAPRRRSPRSTPKTRIKAGRRPLQPAARVPASRAPSSATRTSCRSRRSTPGSATSTTSATASRSASRASTNSSSTASSVRRAASQPATTNEGTGNIYGLEVSAA